MSKRPKRLDRANDSIPSRKFDVQICGPDGRLLCEYTLDSVTDNVRTLPAAEAKARSKLSSANRIILIVSGQYQRGVNQVHSEVNASTQ